MTHPKGQALRVNAAKALLRRRSSRTRRAGVRATTQCLSFIPMSIPYYS
jgi:hypothetical protein